jgi:hypothetical protein
MAGKRNGKPRTCAMCGRTFEHIGHHVCAELPGIVARLTAILPDKNEAGHIITMHEYSLIDDTPLSAHALKRAYGSWAKLAARYGLQCRAAKGIKNRYVPRSKKGVLDDASRAELRRLADLLHGGRIGPSISEYTLYFDAAIGANARTLAARFGNDWRGVVVAAGLTPGTHSEYSLAAIERRRAGTKALVSTEPDPVDYEYDFRGLPVASVQKPTPWVRVLPGGGTATMVR